MLALGLVALMTAGCAQTGATARSGVTVHQLQDAVQKCRQSNQRVQLIDPNAQGGAGGSSYTNIQDSRGRRQTDVSDPAAGSSWYRCLP